MVKFLKNFFGIGAIVFAVIILPTTWVKDDFTYFESWNCTYFCIGAFVVGLVLVLIKIKK